LNFAATHETSLPDYALHSASRADSLRLSLSLIRRLQVTAETALEYFSGFRKAIDIIPTALIWNLDEIRHSDWVDARAAPVFVPSNFKGDSVSLTVPQISHNYNQI
jgi:hypothetical protein